MTTPDLAKHLGHRPVALVIGGGPAGLVAANRLAEGGLATVVLEGSASLGGRAASERRDGFDLNMGPHALFVGGAAMRELGAMGIEPPCWNPTSHRSVLVVDGRATRRPPGSAALAAWLPRMLLSRSDDFDELSAEEWLRRDLRSESARTTAAALIRLATYVPNQETLSAGVAVEQLKSILLRGVRYLHGGWQTLVDALASRAERAGASIRTHAAVRRLYPNGDGWTAELDGRSVRADVVVVAAGGPEAFARVLGNRAPTAPGPAAKASVLDLGMSALPRSRRRFALGVDTPTYLSLHSPPGRGGPALLTVASYGRCSRAGLEAVADAVQPGWRECASLQRYLPRMVSVSAVPGPAVGGLRGRPAIDRGGGLYLAGDWLGPEGWLVDAAVASGSAAAAAALRGTVGAAA